jgi:hypothetical protein
MRAVMPHPSNCWGSRECCARSLQPKPPQQTVDQFDEVVNMARKELEDWLQTDESKSVGQGEGQSKGYEPGRKIVRILGKNKSD